MDRKTSKLWYISQIDYYSQFKENEFEPRILTWVNFKAMLMESFRRIHTIFKLVTYENTVTYNTVLYITYGYA